MNGMQSSSNLLDEWLRSPIWSNSSSGVSNLQELGELKALEIFHMAVETVPAYKDFLKKHHIHQDSIATIADFRNVPPTTKENYINIYDAPSRCVGGSLLSKHMVSTSSGTTGKPHFWPRDIRTEIEGAHVHEMLLQTLYAIAEKKTLFINGFAMGNWIAGTFTQACINLVSWKGYPMTLMTPGYSSETIIETLQGMGSMFDQVIIAGHTPFLKDLVEEMSGKGIDFDEPPLYLLGTGQSISEEWRTYMLSLLHAEHEPHRFVNLYGSADAALMGFETKATIVIRQFLAQHHGLSRSLFSEERLPSLYQYDPRFIYFESVTNELHITKYGGVPLVRYNIHDTGGVLSAGDLSGIATNAEREDEADLLGFPFVYLFGRDKFMTKIYGANVYTEHVQAALAHQALQKKLTGRFQILMDYDTEKNPKLKVRVEMCKGISHDSSLADMVRNIFVSVVSELNSEYKDALLRNGEKAYPEIMLYEHGHQTYFPIGKVKKTA